MAPDLGGGMETEMGALDDVDLSGLDALEAEFELLQAEDVVVSAAKYTQSIIEAPAAIYVVTREDLEGYGFRSMAEALRFAPGVQISSVNESMSLLGVRGFADESTNLVLMLEQGREMNVELFGAPFLENQSFILDDLERIEIIRGPGSTLYGANAFSGVIQAIPKRPGSYADRYHLHAETEFVMGGYAAEMRAAGVTDPVVTTTAVSELALSSTVVAHCLISVRSTGPASAPTVHSSSRSSPSLAIATTSYTA
jgi:iron complex outermembrane receptor protein